ncbi:MAG TPA: hypothetical protein VHP83_17110 [Aggregatilineaceae bacterium]|nr:hypothetical protein [Aggregatilineaceae bacterium]
MNKLGWIIVISLGLLIPLGVTIVWLRQDDPAPTIDPVQDHGATIVYGTPACLEDALLWYSSGTLVYAPFNRPSTPIVAYPDVHPRAWQAVSAGTSAFHLVWLEENNQLRTALISENGTTQRGPIDLANGVQPAFTVLPFAQGSARLLWLDASSASVLTATLDPSGFPRSSSDPLLTQVAFVAAAADASQIAHLVWLVSPATNQWSLLYQPSNAADLVADSPDTLLSFTLDAKETLTGLQIGLDSTHAYVLWSTVHTDQPDAERMFILTFPLDRSVSPTWSELNLPVKLLRWPHVASGQHDTLPLALTVQTDNTWHPALVYFQNGALLRYKIRNSAPPADAGAPTLCHDQLFWLGLRGAVPHLFSATP